MALDLKENWPVVGAVALGVGGLYFLSRGTGGTVVQQTSTAGAQEVAKATLAAEAQQQQSVSGALSTYLSFLANKDNVNAYVDIAHLQALTQEFAITAQANAAGEALAAQEAQYHAQQQTDVWGMILSFLSGIGSDLTGLFASRKASSGAGSYVPGAGGPIVPQPFGGY